MDTKKLLEIISEDCLAQLTKYKYNKGLNISEKYRKGKITSLQYILDLIYYFYEKDRLLKIEFKNIISTQIEDTSLLKDADYQRAIKEVLSWTKNKLNEEKK